MKIVSHLFRLEVYGIQNDITSRVAVLERKDKSLPYLQEGGDDVVQLLPPHQMLGSFSATIESDLSTEGRPYIALRLEYEQEKVHPLIVHLLQHGWKRMTIPVKLAAP